MYRSWTCDILITSWDTTTELQESHRRQAIKLGLQDKHPGANCYDMNINEWHVSHVRIERNVLCFKPNEYYNHRKPKLNIWMGHMFDLGILKCNWNDLHICKGLYGESPKLRKTTLENCLPELQWWFFSSMCGFLADLACFRRVIVPLLILYIVSQGWSIRAESQVDWLMESDCKIPPKALTASKFHIDHGW